jgi:predicted nucleic acid-binding protein
VSRLVLLDNEAVQALRDPAHRKHRRVLAEVEFAFKRVVRTLPVSVAVPAAVRVEAGWDRTASAWAFINRFPIADIPLDTNHADTAAGIVKRTRVSVADAHLGAAIQVADADHVMVLTSDPGDMRRVAEGRQVNVVVL